MSTKPRPRPRPKAKPAVAASNIPSPAISSPSPFEGDPVASCSTSTPISPPAKVELRKEPTDFFMRNSKTEQWISKTVKREAAKVKATQKAAGLFDEEAPVNEEDDDTESSSGKRKRRPRPQTKSPRKGEDWTTSESAVNAIDFSSDSEVVELHSDDETFASFKRRKSDEKPSTKPGADRGRLKGKHRKRPPSLSPPPALTFAEKLQVQMAVNNHFKGSAAATALGASEVTSFDDDTSFDQSFEFSTAHLAPELAAIAKTIEAKGASLGNDFSASGSRSSTRTGPLKTGSSIHEGNDTVPPKTLTITVTWMPHPKDTVRAGDRPPKKWAYLANRSEPLTRVFQAVAQNASVAVSKVMLRYNSRQVFRSSTPDDLKLAEKVEMEAYDCAVWDYILKNPPLSLSPSRKPPSSRQRNTSQSPSTSRPDDNLDEDDEDAANASFVSDTSSAPAAETKIIKLFLRSQSNQSKKVSLNARPTALASSLLRFFLASAGLGEMSVEERQKRRIRLVLDGDDIGEDETVEEIGDGILEDGDVIDVYGV